jgi:hypothetical protein
VLARPLSFFGLICLLRHYLDYIGLSSDALAWETSR